MRKQRTRSARFSSTPVSLHSRMEGGTSTVVKLQDKKCISAYLFNLGLDDQDSSQWDDSELSHLVVTKVEYPSDGEEEEGEEEEEEEEEDQ